MTIRQVSMAFPGETVTVSTVLFDHDGTLVDTIAGLVAGHNEVAKHFGRSALTREDVVQRMASGGGFRIMSDLYGEKRAEEALRLFQQTVGQARKKSISPMPGMERMIKKLSGLQIAMGIVSNANTEMLNDEVDRLGLRTYFPVVIGADEAAKNKPAPDPLYLALERLGLSAEHIKTTIIVGDSAPDLGAAQAAGCHAILIHESGAAPDGYAPIAVFRSCNDFADFLETTFPPS